MMKENSELPLDTILQGDTLQVLKTLPNNSIDTIITSPPYWGLRDYGVEGQIGLEPTLDLYIEHLLQITAELKRVLKPTGVMFWNHGDSYCGSQGHFDAKNPKAREGKLIPDWGDYPKKCLYLQNYRIIIHMIDEQGWILRNTIIWHKPNHMPSSVQDRFTNAYEPIFMLTKSKKYYFDLDAVRVPHKTNAANKLRNKSKESYNNSYPGGHFSQGERPEGHPLGKNPGDLWSIPTQPFPEAHFATFPEKLVEPMIKAGCPQWICKKCGKPRERIIETVGYSYHGNKRKRANAPGAEVSPKSVFNTGVIAEKTTTGWIDCGCNAGWHPGVVLDPFAGSGTTLYVARKLGRHYIGIELNPEYVKMAKKRLSVFGERLDKFVKI